MVALLLSVVFFALAFFIGLPTIMMRPHKFALTFTLGSFFFMGSFAMLKVIKMNRSAKWNLSSLREMESVLVALSSGQ